MISLTRIIFRTTDDTMPLNPGSTGTSSTDAPSIAGVEQQPIDVFNETVTE